ncbi:MAG: hypothetical protein AAGB02_01860 [Pseudomonadota bacterium]
MSRNWGLPTKIERAALRDAKTAKPILTLLVTVTFGVIGAAIAAISFNEARDVLSGLFRGGSLVGVVLAAGFGCWAYIWLARPRFAAHFSGPNDPFSDLLRFYVRAAIGLFVLMIIARFVRVIASDFAGVMVLCAAGGAAAAAAFQTVLAFVPGYTDDSP